MHLTTSCDDTRDCKWPRRRLADRPPRPAATRRRPRRRRGEPRLAGGGFSSSSASCWSSASARWRVRRRRRREPDGHEGTAAAGGTLVPLLHRVPPRVLLGHGRRRAPPRAGLDADGARAKCRPRPRPAERETRCAGRCRPARERERERVAARERGERERESAVCVCVCVRLKSPAMPTELRGRRPRPRFGVVGFKVQSAHPHTAATPVADSMGAACGVEPRSHCDWPLSLSPTPRAGKLGPFAPPRSRAGERLRDRRWQIRRAASATATTGSAATPSPGFSSSAPTDGRFDGLSQLGILRARARCRRSATSARADSRARARHSSDYVGGCRFSSAGARALR